MSEKQILQEALAYVAKVAKAKGFSKKAMTFSRQHGAVYQIVDFSLARGGFILQIGLMFDELGTMYEAMGNYFADTLVNYSFQIPDTKTKTWKVGDDASLLSQRIIKPLSTLWPRLDAISSASTMIQNEALDEGQEKLLRAQLKYVSKDYAGALRDVEQVAQEFAGRKLDGKLQTIDSLIEGFSMPELKKLRSSSQ
jgi:hypothetical protein